MGKKEQLKLCPFCGGNVSLGIRDDEGNHRNEDYENDPYSGLTFTILHDHESNKDCPIAKYKEDGGMMGVYLYESRHEAMQAWNKRVD